MEIEGSDGSKTLIEQGSKIEFGRGSGFKPNDRTVSRRHLSFEPHPSGESRARFKVIGMNPIWVHSSKTGEVSAFRTSERGELESGDMFCVSAKNPIWFALRKIESQKEEENGVKGELGLESELAESLESGCGLKDVGDLEPESVDISHIDPAKEFGFVVGEDFDRCKKNMIREMKNWNWFIDDPVVESEFDEVKKRKKGERRKRKKGEENDDEEWTGESEEEKEQLVKARKLQKPKYLTRSKDRDIPSKETGKCGHSIEKKTTSAKSRDVDEEEEDDDGKKLGGFIVDNEELEEEEEVDEEDEEEEFEEGNEEELDD